MLPLVDRPLLSYTFEHLARYGVERAIVSCGYLPHQIGSAFGASYGGVALEYAVETQPLGTGGAIGFAAPRARGELLRAERGLAARGRSRRARSLPPLDRREGDDPAHAGRRPEPLRARADRRRRARRELPREAAAGGDRHRPHQRRPLRARARGAGARPRRGARSRSSARSSRGSPRRERSSASRSPGTGSTSGRPSRTSRPIATSSSARSRPTSGTSSAPTSRSSIRAPRSTRARGSCRPSTSGPARSSRPGARVGSLAVLGDGSLLGAGAIVENAVVGARRDVGARLARRRLDPRRRGRARRRAASSATSPSSGPARRSAPATSSTTACASAPTSESRRRRSASRERRERYARLAPARREAVGLGAHLGRDGRVRRQAPLRPRRRGAEPPVPRGEGRVLARARGRARLELGRGGSDGGELETVEIAGRRAPLPAGTLHRVTALEDTLIVEVSTPHLDDVVRVEDRYGREGTSAP